MLYKDLFTNNEILQNGFIFTKLYQKDKTINFLQNIDINKIDYYFYINFIKDYNLSYFCENCLNDKLNILDELTNIIYILDVSNLSELYKIYLDNNIDDVTITNIDNNINGNNIFSQNAYNTSNFIDLNKNVNNTTNTGTTKTTKINKKNQKIKDFKNISNFYIYLFEKIRKYFITLF